MSLYVGQNKIGKVGVLFYDGNGSAVMEENIKKGVRILGVEGNYTSDGTQTIGYDLATSDDILQGKSAWADGQEVLGNLELNHYYYGEEVPNDSFGNNGDVFLRI